MRRDLGEIGRLRERVLALNRAYRPAADERLAIVLCGANTDPSDLL